MTQNVHNRLIKQYQRLLEVSHSLAGNLELDSLLNNIMDVSIDMVEAEAASILLYDQNTHRLYFETATNSESSPMLQKLFVPEESIAGWVALNRKPQIINRVEEDNRHFSNIDEQTKFSTRSMIAVPLVAKQKLIGVLEVLNKKEGMFDDEDQEILLALAAQAAIAIENSRLFQQSDLIAEFVHELRTPLASIFTASYLLLRSEIANEQRIKLAQTVHNETQRLNELATIFLDLASLQSGRATLQATLFPPRPLLEECLQLLQIKANEKNIKLHLVAEEPLADIEGDHNKLKQVLINLLNNAVKYNRSDGDVWLKAYVTGDRFYLAIQDTGVGIPPDQADQLFTRFFRARNVERTTPGTGLGLSISKRIIEMHGGDIEVESVLDVGTTFTIHIPLKQI